MPRIVRVFALEEMGSMNEPIVSTPFGSLTVRQTAILALFLITGWTVHLTLAKIVSQTYSLMVFGGFALAGLVIALKKTKSIPLEAQIYYAIFKPKPRKPGAKKGLKAEKAGPEKVEKVLSLVVESEEFVPKKVAGELRDQFGNLLKNVEYYVYVNDRKYSEKAFVSDSSGRYEFYFLPPSTGVFEVKVVPKGASVPSDVVKVRVDRMVV